MPDYHSMKEIQYKINSKKFYLNTNPKLFLEFGILNFEIYSVYPTKLITFPGTIMTLFGVLPSSCLIVLSSAKTIS